MARQWVGCLQYLGVPAVPAAVAQGRALGTPATRPPTRLLPTPLRCCSYCKEGTAPQNCEPFFHLAASYYRTLSLPDGSPQQYLAAAWG